MNEQMPETPEAALVQQFSTLSPDDQSMLVRQLDAQLRVSNQRLAAHRDQLAGVLQRLRPVVPLFSGDRIIKGRVQCIVCHSQGKRREFRHMSRCEWVLVKAGARRERQEPQ
jgi:hypothetical protein